MQLQELKRVQKQLIGFVEEFKPLLGRKERSHWCHYYLSGLLLNGERKSIEPMAERLPGGNKQAMQQFVNQSPWEHQAVQIHLANHLGKKLASDKGILVLDDTSLPKKGNQSVGVARQYCGALGKVSNCQSLVTWHYVTERGEHFPLVEELYLPQVWSEDKKRLKRCGVPSDRRIFKKKWEIALELLDTLKKEALGYEAIVFDAGYGEIKEFLSKLDALGETYLAQIPESHGFWMEDVKLTRSQAAVERPRIYPEIKDSNQKPRKAKEWPGYLLSQGKTWKRIQLHLKSKKSSQMMAVRVKGVITQAYWRPGAAHWLIIEKLGNGQFKYYVSNAAADIGLKHFAKWVHERWRIEQGYQQLKEELGLDHFEGRSYQGLHHHVTLCFMAYAFLLLLKKQGLKKM
jgi:SRSO17 transposase